MTRVIGALVAAAAVASPWSAPAHAESSDGQVLISYFYRAEPAEGGYVVAAECDATAHSAVRSDIAVATTVTCRVNGAETTVPAPGEHSAAAVVTAAIAPVDLCWSGSATFIDSANQSSYTVERAEECLRIRES